MLIQPGTTLTNGSCGLNGQILTTPCGVARVHGKKLPPLHRLFHALPSSHSGLPQVPPNSEALKQPQAYLVVVDSTNSSQLWYTDFGATHHVNYIIQTLFLTNLGREFYLHNQ